MKKPLFIVLIIAFFLLELILKVSTKIGLVMYILIAGLILINFEKDEVLSHSEKLLIFLMIIPIARISEFFLDFNFFIETLIFYLALFFLTLYYKIKFDIKLGLNLKNFTFLPLGIIIGFFLGFFGNMIFDSEKHFLLLALLPLIAYSEEVLFRGMIQNYSEKEYGGIFAIITTSMLFAIFSLSFGLNFALFMFLANLIICSVYSLSKNIWITIPINLFMNLLIFCLNIGSFEIFTGIW